MVCGSFETRSSNSLLVRWSFRAWGSLHDSSTAEKCIAQALLPRKKISFPCCRVLLLECSGSTSGIPSGSLEMSRLLWLYGRSRLVGLIHPSPSSARWNRVTAPAAWRSFKPLGRGHRRAVNRASRRADRTMTSEVPASGIEEWTLNPAPPLQGAPTRL